MKKYCLLFGFLLACAAISVVLAQETQSNKSDRSDKPDKVSIKVPKNKSEAVVAVKQTDVQPTPMNFSEATQTVIAFGLPDLSDSEVASVSNFFGDGTDTHPRVVLLKNMVYRKAIRDGAIPPNTEIGAVNWQGLLAFIQGLLPIIEAIIKMFGG